jgi:hypothetical protein
VIVAGLSMSMPGTMNNLVIHTIGEEWIEADPAADVKREFPRLAEGGF